MILTGSRGPILALLPTITAFIIIKKRKTISFLLLAMSIIFVLIIPSKITQPIGKYLIDSFKYGASESTSISERIILTRDLINIFKENPILGYGPGIIQKRGARGESQFEYLVGLENQYASILADSGFLAGLLFLAYIIGIITLLLKIYNKSQNKGLKTDSLMVLTLFIYLLINALGASNLLGGPIIDVVMIVLGCTVSQYDRESVH
jgi:O-antigen ligase